MYINNFQRLSRISYKTIKRDSKQMFVCVMLKGVWSDGVVTIYWPIVRINYITIYLFINNGNIHV
jgi:hypothetical protein